MKTHLLQLDSFDDFNSIIDKMNWSKANRVLIVWPNKCNLSLNEKEIVLLLRKAESLGSQIAFVSDDIKIIEICKYLGIDVFSSIPEAQKKPWRRPKKIKKKVKLENAESKFNQLRGYFSSNNGSTILQNRVFRNIFFILGLLSITTLIGIFIPSAIVEIKTVPKPLVVEVNLWTNPSIQSPTLSGAVPLEIVYKEKSDLFEGKSTGTTRIPNDFAKGILIFRNLTDRVISIPSGTIVSTSSEPLIRFKTLRPITLNGEINSEAEVQAESLEGGVIGNVSPLSINAIEGLIGGSVVVENRTQFVGGSDIKTLSPSEYDFENAKSFLIKRMKQEFLEEIKIEHPEGFLFPEESIKISKIIYEKKNPELNNPGESFFYQLSCEFSIWMIKSEDINIVLTNAINANLPVSYEKVPNTRVIDMIYEPAFDESMNMEWKISATEIIKPLIDTDQIKNMVIGKSIGDAKKILGQMDYLDPQIEIKVNPPLLKFIPFIPLRIMVTINE